MPAKFAFLISLTTCLLGISPALAEPSLQSDQWSKKFFSGVKAQDQRDFSKANRCFEEARRESDKFDMSDPRKALTLRTAAGCYEYQNKSAKAEQLFTQLISLQEQVFDKDYPRVADAYTDLGRMLMEKGECSRAEQYYQKALAIYEKTLGPNNLRTNQILGDLGQNCIYQGKFDEAVNFYKRGLAIATQEERHIPSRLDEYAAALEGNKRVTEAKKLLQDSYDVNACFLH